MTLLDRVVRWGLDSDGKGDIYGDERERLRWYEGIATAASLQWLAIPWAAAVLVWPLGMPSVLPLTVVLVLLVIPMALCTVYVRRRRVDTEVRAWTGKRVWWSVLGSLPYVVFMIGALYAHDPESSTWQGAIFGAVLGGGDRSRRRGGRRPAPAAPGGPRCRERGRGLMAPPAGPVRAAETDGAAGTRIRAVRREAGLTQQDLATAVEVSRQTIIAMETGDYAPSVYLAIKIARALGTTVERLWADPGSHPIE